MRSPAWFVVVVLMLTACSFGDESAGSDGSSVSAAEPPAGPATAGEQQPGPGSDSGNAQTPLAVRLGYTQSPEELSAQYAAALEMQAESVTACVRAEGFPEFFQPASEAPSPEQFAGSEIAEVDLTTAGYGESAGLQASVDGFSRPDMVDVDPFLNSLTDEELHAFAQAYNSCSEAAYHEYPPPNQPAAQVAELIDEFEVDGNHSGGW